MMVAIGLITIGVLAALRRETAPPDWHEWDWRKWLDAQAKRREG